jgi:hypothetical protein
MAVPLVIRIRAAWRCCLLSAVRSNGGAFAMGLSFTHGKATSPEWKCFSQVCFTLGSGAGKYVEKKIAARA